MVVVDTETTGDGPEDQVVELAAVWPGGHTHFLVRPTVPVHVEARAAHHISDATLAQCSPAPEWRETVERILANHGAPVFHNAEFDTRLIQQTWPGVVVPPAICTYRVCHQLWPECPRHSNQVLRYWLGVEPYQKLGRNLPPHRALPDAAVTYAILERILRDRVDPATEEQREQILLDLTAAPIVQRTIRFGKHRGELWSDLPRDYLEWVLKKDFDVDTKHTTQHWLREKAL